MRSTTFLESHMRIIAKKIHIAFHRRRSSSKASAVLVYYLAFSFSHLLQQKDYVLLPSTYLL